MEKIHDCQTNANEEIYMKAYNMIEKYFSDEEDGPEIVGDGAGMNGVGTTFGEPAQGGFNFNTGGESMDM